MKTFLSVYRACERLPSAARGAKRSPKSVEYVKLRTTFIFLLKTWSFWGWIFFIPPQIQVKFKCDRIHFFSFSVRLFQWDYVDFRRSSSSNSKIRNHHSIELMKQENKHSSAFWATTGRKTSRESLAFECFMRETCGATAKQLQQISPRLVLICRLETFLRGRATISITESFLSHFLHPKSTTLL